MLFFLFFMLKLLDLFKVTSHPLGAFSCKDRKLVLCVNNGGNSVLRIKFILILIKDDI